MYRPSLSQFFPIFFPAAQPWRTSSTDLTGDRRRRRSPFLARPEIHQPRDLVLYRCLIPADIYDNSIDYLPKAGHDRLHRPLRLRRITLTSIYSTPTIFVPFGEPPKSVLTLSVYLII